MRLFCRPSGAFGTFFSCSLGLTPQAMYLSLLRSSFRWVAGLDLKSREPEKGIGQFVLSEPQSGETCLAWGVSPREKSFTIARSPRRGRHMMSLGREPQDQDVPKRDQPRSGDRFSSIGVSQGVWL